MKKELTTPGKYVINSRRLPNFIPLCAYAKHTLPCWNQSRRAFLCPIEDRRFVRLLDYYFDGIKSDDIPGVRDPRALKNLKSIEIAVWFDNDFLGLMAWGTYKLTGEIRMTKFLCNEFRKAWARYFVRLKPFGVIAPKWLGGYSRWAGISMGYQKKFSGHSGERK